MDNGRARESDAKGRSRRFAETAKAAGALVVLVGIFDALLVGTVRAGEGRTFAAPCLQSPSVAQLRWHGVEFYGLLHFGLNTFTDKEWGFGDESPALFNPTAFDADQIVGTAREAGMKGLISVCKHHDGFCLWPSQYTEHSVKKSPWRAGKGDVVKEISDSCRRQGLAFGVYLSPWDRNHKDYGRPECLTYYRNQLRELLTNYGEVFILWFDGAQGGEGYYGGDRRPRVVDRRTYYDWPGTWAMVRQLQPNAVIFSDAGPDVRWVGNETGYADEPCWATVNLGKWYPGGPHASELGQGHRPGTHWAPAECDVPLRIGWFYHPREDVHVKPPQKLVDIWYGSVGRGACLNLGLAPDRRGRIHENDVAALREMRRILDATFATNLASKASAIASDLRGGTDRFDPAKALDGDLETYWATDDAIATAELVVDLGRPTEFNVVRLREYLPLGQRIDAFALDQWEDSEWREFFRGTSIGNQRLIRAAPVTTNKVRLRVTKAAACPVLSHFGLFLEPEVGDETSAAHVHGP